MTAVPENRLEELPLLRAHRADALGEHEVGEPDDGVERGAQLVAHVGEELALGGGPLQLHVLRRQRALAPADLVQHRRAIEADHHLIPQGLEQLEVVLGEGRPSRWLYTLTVPMTTPAERSGTIAAVRSRTSRPGIR